MTCESNPGSDQRRRSNDFGDFYDRFKTLFIDPNEDRLLHHEDAVTLEDLTSSDFSPLFRRVALRGADIQSRFFASFLEGIGYRDTTELGRGISRLLHIPWLRPQPSLTIEALREHAVAAYRTFAAFGEDGPELIIITDLNQAVEVHDTLEADAENSYGYAYPYNERLLDNMSLGHGQQKTKHQVDNRYDKTFVVPQHFMIDSITMIAIEEAEKIVARTNVRLEGTGEEIRKKIERLPQVLTPHVRVVVDGYLAALDIGVEPNPFEPLIAMYEAGVVPLGGLDNRFYVFIPGLEESIPGLSIPQLP